MPANHRLPMKGATVVLRGIPNWCPITHLQIYDLAFEKQTNRSILRVEALSPSNACTLYVNRTGQPAFGLPVVSRWPQFFNTFFSECRQSDFLDNFMPAGDRLLDAAQHDRTRASMPFSFVAILIRVPSVKLKRRWLLLARRSQRKRLFNILSRNTGLPQLTAEAVLATELRRYFILHCKKRLVSPRSGIIWERR